MQYRWRIKIINLTHKLNSHYFTEYYKKIVKNYFLNKIIVLPRNYSIPENVPNLQSLRKLQN